MPTKQAKPIALIANSYHSGRAYLYDKFKSGPERIFNNNGSYMRFPDGTEVVIITNAREADGREFSGFWIHPDYQDELIASVQVRVR